MFLPSKSMSTYKVIKKNAPPIPSTISFLLQTNQRLKVETEQLTNQPEPTDRRTDGLKEKFHFQ